jgi:hypothetical protein
MKKFISALTLVLLSFSVSWAAPWTEPLPKGNQFAANTTMFVACTKAPYPGGMSCSQPSSLGSLYTASSFDSALLQYGCTGASSGYVYFCSGYGLEGAIMFWKFTDGSVSTVLYVPSAVQ